MFKNTSLLDEEKDLILKMSDAIDFRGPDEGRGVFYDRVGVGFRRLSIIDLELGSQPFERDNLLGVFNGEIYNYRELRQTLIDEGESFTTNSEIEVMLTLYKKHGEEFINL